jgi:gluconate 2-dehydrogenase subunit 3-like protein
MDRRDLVKLLGISIVVGPEGLWAHEHADQISVAATLDVAGYKPRFLTAQEYQTLGRLCDVIIPADETSPGAAEAGVPFYIDSVLFYAKPDEQQLWRNGLKQVQQAAMTQFEHPFEECRVDQRESIVAQMAVNEGAPQTELEKFFAPLKSVTVSAYWLSDAGMEQYLGYRGDTMLRDFPGCTHPEHQTA